jgi:hypothetical protein
MGVSITHSVHVLSITVHTNISPFCAKYELCARVTMERIPQRGMVFER